MDINKLAIGTAQFGLNYGIANRNGQVSIGEIENILEFSKGYGINSLDTAIDYGDSEGRLGIVGVDGWNVISKLPSIPNSCRNIKEWVFSSVEGSLNRLKIDSLYGLLLHRPEELTKPYGEELYDALQYVKSSGMVLNTGISIYSPDELELYNEFSDLNIIQSPFNVIDRRITENNLSKSLAQKGRLIHTRSAFLQGLLLMTPEERPKKFSRWNKLWMNYDTFISNSGLSRLEVCIRYVISRDEISNVIIGIDNLKQLKEICAAASESLSVLPDDFKTEDLELLNPSFWSTFE